MLKVYHHPRCSTCKKALSFLEKKSAKYKTVDLTENGPSKAELSKMLNYIEPNKLFNTSGKRYRELNLKDKKDSMTKSEIVNLLAKEPMLVKRPFVLSSSTGIVGFKEQDWKALLKS